MEVECPIGSKCASQISALLQSPSPLQVQEYFKELIESRHCRGIKVKQDGEFGKCVIAHRDYEEGELVLKDQMLVGAQHLSNKIDCLVCSYCFQFIGSVELQIGRRLYLQDLGVFATDECKRGMPSHSSKGFEVGSSDEEDDLYMRGCSNFDGLVSSSSNKRRPLPSGVAELLMNGDLSLPYSSKFPLPPSVPCPGGCGEAFYCSKSCAETDWAFSHSLLCTGEGSESRSREALSEFIQHANETNDIFILAAKTVAYTILRYRKLRAAHKMSQHTSDATVALDSPEFSLLLQAWKSISIGHKERWWDCISLPDDVDASDEASFRLEIKELAFKSLQLLKSAIFDKECEPLFSLEIYGNIIGMFELNNLYFLGHNCFSNFDSDLVVASPVEDYFLYINDLPDSEKVKAEEITQPFLDALGDEYSVCCQGTAFYPLQSCMNHSCCANAKAFKREEDRDGQATIVAVRHIHAGEEITISYVDEDLPYEERGAQLADYGFGCRCSKCLEEEQQQL